MAEYTDGMKEEVRAVFVFCSVVVWKETCGREPVRERIKFSCLIHCVLLVLLLNRQSCARNNEM
jgi:hypothetical protein